MAIKRGGDGRIIEDDIQGGSRSNDGVTRKLDGKMPPLPVQAERTGIKKNAGDETISPDGKAQSATEAELKKNVRTIGDDRTRLVRPGQQKDKDKPASQVVGWVVVLRGPGKGASREIGYGNNPVGRSREAAINLDFADETISREKHCVLTYDPKSRQYFISPGESRNLVYLNDTPVLAPTVLSAGDKLGLGKTLLSFVPFCGADFDWEDLG